jgi:hypothetical protein
MSQFRGARGRGRVKFGVRHIIGLFIFYLLLAFAS